MRADQVIIEPVLSEKSNVARDAECKKYTFKVNLDANKFEVMSAVKELFKVNPVKCNVVNMGGKPKFSRGKGGNVKGRTANWKKAIITLSKGEVISEIEGV